MGNPCPPQILQVWFGYRYWIFSGIIYRYGGTGARRCRNLRGPIDDQEKSEANGGGGLAAWHCGIGLKPAEALAEAGGAEAHEGLLRWNFVLNDWNVSCCLRLCLRLIWLMEINSPDKEGATPAFLLSS